MLRVTISMWEIVGGVVRYCDLVAKIHTAKFFPGVFVGDSRKFVLAKISRYVVSCQLEATRHTFSLVRSSSSHLDAPHKVPTAQWVVLGVE